MTDNILEMIKDFKPEKKEPKKEEPVVEEQKNEVILTATVADVGVTSLNRFFESNKEKFAPEIKQTNMAVSGIDKDEILVLTTPDPKGGTLKDGTEKRVLHTFRDVSRVPVLDLEPVKFNIYKNGRFRIIHYAGNRIFLKSYGVLTGLIISHCVQVGNILIPYCRNKLKKKEKIIHTIPVNISAIERNLADAADIETVRLKYTQFNKIDYSGFKTTLDIVNWFQSKDSEINDTNHLILIDDVIMKITQK